MPSLPLKQVRTYCERLAQADIPETQRTHYLRWLERYFAFGNQKTRLPSEPALMEQFLTSMSTRYADWQVRQARQALNLASDILAADDSKQTQATDEVPATPGPDTEAKLAHIASRVKCRMEQSIEEVIAIGVDLNLAKSLLPHGEFTPWIRAEFGMSYQTANRFMHAAQAFADKIPTVRILSKKALYELAAPDTDPELQAAVLTRLEAGESVEWQEIHALKQQPFTSGLVRQKREFHQLSQDFDAWSRRLRHWLAAEPGTASDAAMTSLLTRLKGVETRLEAHLTESRATDRRAA